MCAGAHLPILLQPRVRIPRDLLIPDVFCLELKLFGTSPLTDVGHGEKFVDLPHSRRNFVDF